MEDQVSVGLTTRRLPLGRNKALRRADSDAGFGPRRNGEELFRPIWMLVVILLAAATSSESAETRGEIATLTLANGDSTTGRLIKSDRPHIVRWQSEGFVAPFEFAQRDVVSIHYRLPAEAPVPTGDYSFELTGGDLLFGKLAGLSATTAELDVALFGRVHLPRSSLRRIRRWGDGADLLYLGPNGLADWDSSSPAGAWREETGHLITEQARAFIQKDFKLPAQAVIEFEISWKSKPDFSLALGVAADNPASKAGQPFRFETWQSHLVAMRETDDEADVASVGNVDQGPGRMHIVAYLDQQQHRMFVVSPTGNKLADLRVASGRDVTSPGIRLTNISGHVRLERLRISRWNGDEPRELQIDKTRLHRADGAIVYGELKSFDPAAAEFVIANDDGESRIAATDVGSVVLHTEETGGQSVRAVLRDGTRLSGQLAGVQDGKLLLSYPSIAAPLAIPIAELHLLLALDAQLTIEPREGLSGQLELKDAKLTGTLMPGKGTPQVGSLVWQPHASATASVLLPGTAGRIVYRQSLPHQRIFSPKPILPARRGLLPLPALLGPYNSDSRTAPVNTSAKRAMHLRTGDTIPCEVTAIDETGVAFKSESTEATFVPHDKIKAVELSNVRLNAALDPVKQERLLTLPRIQRNNPPTHLIRFFNGDYLRARIESMDEAFLMAEVRLESKRFNRSDIVEIIWLHEFEIGDEPEAAGQQSFAPNHVQAVRRDGTRLTFHPQEFDGKMLSGISDALGRCRVELADVDLLLIGQQVDDAAAELAYGRWRLRHAIDPRWVSADDTAARPLGSESNMVGKPAPDFTLQLLDGTLFQLSRYKGKVVILDFWATWCIPCIQAMPQIDEVAREFADRGVELIAVNLLEAPDKIKSSLQRLKLDPTVALDIDGVAADRYDATSIPQTVIIDRDGNVARLFVGVAPDFAEQLRAALQSIVDGD